MQLDEYTTPAPADPYAPRPRASQIAGARQRQRDTEPLTPIAVSLAAPRPYMPVAIGATLIVLAMIGMVTYQLLGSGSPKALQLVPTVAATTAPSVSQAAPTLAPTAAPAIARIDAYAAPDGLVLGQIEIDREIIPVAHLGTDWIQAEVTGSGLIWLRAVDVPDVALIGPDLAPRVAVAPEPQTGRGMAVEPPPAPEQQPAPEPAPDADATGQKAAPDRAAHHATAVARLALPPPARDGDAPMGGK